MNRKKWQATPIALYLTSIVLFFGGLGLLIPLVTAGMASENSPSSSHLPLELDVRLPPKGAPGDRKGGGARDGFCSSDENLIALVPGTNLGLTVAERPTFWFYVPYERGRLEAEFWLEDREGNEVSKQIFTLKISE